MAGEEFNSELERLLAERLDGQLSPSESRALDELLAADPRARCEAVALERLDSLLRRSVATGPRVDWSAFHARVMDQVRGEAVRRSAKYRVMRLVYAAVPLAAAAVLAFVVSTSPWMERPSKPAGAGVAPPVVSPAVDVAFRRPAAPTAARLRSTIEVTFQRSDDLARRTADRDAAEMARPEYAVASSTGATAVPIAELFDASPI